MVAPFIKIIDRSIFENASGKRHLYDSLRDGFKEFITHPWKVFQRKGIRYIFGVYFPTYLAANFTTTFCELEGVSPEIPKFLIISATNLSLSIVKDTNFTKMFGVKEPSKLPLSSLLLFGVRDSITILASFNAPKYFSLYL